MPKASSTNTYKGGRKDMKPKMAGWGPERPTYTMKAPAPYPVFNSITDNPVIGDERNFCRIREDGAQAPFGDRVRVVPGRRYIVYIGYDNNTVVTSEEGVARDVRVLSTFPPVVKPQEWGKISAAISSTTTKPPVVWDGCNVWCEEPVRLRYVAGSARLHSYTLDNEPIPEAELFSKNGTLIGYKKLDGVVPGDVGARANGNIKYELEAEPLLASTATVATPSRSFGTYLGHSGFILELPSATLLFDWYQGELPHIRKDKPLYVFISHIHGDHFRWDALSLAGQHPQAQIFLGYDRSMASIPQIDKALKSLPEGIQDKMSCFVGEQRLYSDDGKMLVESLRSTDLGVAFLVQIEGKTIYHAGDLALWTRPRDEYMQRYVAALVDNPDGQIDNYETYVWRNTELFRKCIKPLRGVTVDYGMLPLDPLAGDSGIKTVEEYLAVANFKAWSPMHLWGQYGITDAFAASHAEAARRMIAVTNSANCRLSIKPGQRYLLGD